MTAVPMDIVTPEQILTEVAREHRLPPRSLGGPWKHHRVPNHVRAATAEACRRLRRALDMSIQAIGRLLRIHHATVYDFVRVSDGYMRKPQAGPLSDPARDAHIYELFHMRGQSRSVVAKTYGITVGAVGNAVARHRVRSGIPRPGKGDRCRVSVIAPEVDSDGDEPTCDACGSRVGYRTPRELRYNFTEQHMCIAGDGWARRYDGNVAEGMTTGRVRA